MAEEERCVVDEAQSVAAWIEALEGPLTPWARLDRRQHFGTGGARSFVDRIELKCREVDVVRCWLEVCRPSTVQSISATITPPQ